MVFGYKMFRMFELKLAENISDDEDDDDIDFSGARIESIAINALMLKHTYRIETIIIHEHIQCSYLF